MASESLLTSLPSEILFLIVHDLNMFDKEALARTYNKSLYAVARPGLDILWINHARRMVVLFDKPFKTVERSPRPGIAHAVQPTFPGHLPAFPFGPIPGFYYSLPAQITCLPDKTAAIYDLDPLHGPWVRNSPTYFKDILPVDGSFSWLFNQLKEPSSDTEDLEDDGQHDPPLPTESLLDGEELDLLKSQLKKLGLNLPAGFEPFARSVRVHREINDLHCWLLYVKPLVQCPASVDGGAGGYLLWFYGDQQACGNVSIYLNPAGYHCILGSVLDPTRYHEDYEYSDGNEWFPHPPSQIHPKVDENDSRCQDIPCVQEDGFWEPDEDYVACAKRAVQSGGITRAELDSAYEKGLRLALTWRKEDYMVHAFSFEEFIATIYWEGQIGCSPEDRPGIDEYVKKVFTPPPASKSNSRTPTTATSLQKSNDNAM